ncbi:hypothetical protein AVEN_77430-1, partial [Araneus ventricosus]
FSDTLYIICPYTLIISGAYYKRNKNILFYKARKLEKTFETPLSSYLRPTNTISEAHGLGTTGLNEKQFTFTNIKIRLISESDRIMQTKKDQDEEAVADA